MRADGQATTHRLVGKAGLGEGHFFCVIDQFSGRCAHPPQTTTIITVHTDEGAENTAHHFCPWHQFLLVSHHHQKRRCQECACKKIPLRKPCIQKTSVLWFAAFGSKPTSVSLFNLRCNTTAIPAPHAMAQVGNCRTSPVLPFQLQYQTASKHKTTHGDKPRRKTRDNSEGFA